MVVDAFLSDVRESRVLDREGERRKKETRPRGVSSPVAGRRRAFKECRRIGRNHRMLTRKGWKDGANLLSGYDGRDDQGLVETRL